MACSCDPFDGRLRRAGGGGLLYRNAAPSTLSEYYTFLDKELQQGVREAETGRWRVDKLVLQEAAFRMETGGTRSEYSFIYDTKRGVAVLFGGRRSFRSAGDLEAKYVTVLNDTWEYDGEKWYEIRPSQSPPPRYLHAMAYDEARGVIVLFGGADADNNALNDTWEYDGITWVQR